MEDCVKPLPLFVTGFYRKKFKLTCDIWVSVIPGKNTRVLLLKYAGIPVNIRRISRQIHGYLRANTAYMARNTWLFSGENQYKGFACVQEHIGSGRRHCDTYLRPFTRLAIDVDLAVLGFDQRTCDGQSQPVAAAGFVFRSADLVKTLE
jgi:hypothetical protein